MGKNDPQNNLECKFVHQPKCAIDPWPLTPHNTTPDLVDPYAQKS